MRLILHAGTEKTGTTSIQSVLFRNRDWLRQRGVFYPSEAGRKNRHHSFATNLISPSTAAAARQFLEEAAAAAGTCHTILLSTEWLYSAAHNPSGIDFAPIEEETYWTARKRYLADLADICAGFDTELVLFLRRPDDYAEACYKTFVAQGRYSQSFRTFLASYAPQFEYSKQLEALRSSFSVVRVLSYDASQADIVGAFFHEIGFPVPPATECQLNQSTDARLTLWMARGNAGGSAEAAAVAKERLFKKRRAFSSSQAARRLFADFGQSTLWLSNAEREEFVSRMTSGLESDFFCSTTNRSRETAQLDQDTIRQITGAYRLWRLRSFIGLQ
jgi:hypothetical protein